jgi:uncharacterized SAM-binding protein YcdF (DUF218 family)
MYPSQIGAATNTHDGRTGFIVRAATGAALGIFCALLAAALGLGEIFRSSGYNLIGPLAIAGAVIGVTRLRPALWILAGAGAAVVLLVAYTSIIVRPAQALIRRDEITAPADAIVVLSGGITADGTLHPQATDRLLKGLELLVRRVAPTIVLTREDRNFGGVQVTSQADQQRIASLTGAGSGRVVYAGPTRTTRAEALRIRALAQSAGWKRIVLVTSPLHSRRACAVFEHVGFTVTCVPSESRDLAVGRMITAEDRLRAFQLWIYEVAGTLRYRQRGWL